MTEENNQKPNYFGILPASVRYDKSLHPNAKIIYTEISSLCNKEGYCWASNSYFSELFSVTPRSVINWINNLREKKYIRTELIFKNGTKEVRERRIYICDPILTRNLLNKGLNGGEENFTTPGENPDITPSEENFTTGNENNFMSPSEENFRPSEENFTYINKPLSKKDLSLYKPTFEECEAHAEKENFSIDVKKFYKFYFVDSDEPTKLTWKQLMRKWAEKPENIVKKENNQQSAIKIPQDEKAEEKIKEIKSKLKFELGKINKSSAILFLGDIRKTGEGFEVFTKDNRVLEFKGILDELKLKINLN